VLLKLSSIHGWNEKQLELFLLRGSDHPKTSLCIILAERHGLRKPGVFSQPADPLLLRGRPRGFAICLSGNSH
jgi:hypothetical protein